HILEQGDRRLAMEVWCLVVMLRPAGGMPEKGQEEEQAEGEGEGMAIEREGQASLAYGPRCVRIMLMRAGILVSLIRGIGIFGLCRAALKEKDRQEHVGGHLQKLA